MNGKNICAILKKVNQFIISLNDLSDLFVGLLFLFILFLYKFTLNSCKEINK